MPVLPVPLVATVLLASRPARDQRARAQGRPWPTLVRGSRRGGARIYVPRSDWDYAVSAGLRMLTQRHLVDEEDGAVPCTAHRKPRLLRYYANSIAHLVTPR